MTTGKHHPIEARPRVRSWASGRFLGVRSIADPEAAKDLAAFRKRIMRTPEAAMEYLQGVGILTAKGKLSRRYGGK